MWGAGILAAFLVISGTSALADESSIPEDVQALVEAGDCPGKAHEDFETPMTPSGSFDSFLEEMCEKDSKFCIDSHSYVKVRTLMRKYGGSGPSDPKVQSCKNLVYHHYCEQSPWKDLDVRERFEKMMEYSKKYAPQNGLPAALLPCIATAETTNLEPSYVHMKNCSHKEASAQGLGQFIYEPFFDDGLGLPNEAVKRMLAKKHLKPWMQERTQLTPDELKHRHPWAFKG
ncbi:MAG: hypothetical protein ACXVBW_11245, partial [Bdellovibrionota bacterium]